MTRIGDLFAELGKLRQRLKDAGPPGPTAGAQRKRPQVVRDVKVVHKKARGPGGERNVQAATQRPAAPRRARTVAPPPPPPGRPPPRPAVRPQPAVRVRPAPVETPAPAARPQVAPATDPVDRLWADTGRLVIKASRANSRAVDSDVADPTTEGALAVVGLDFGTAFTKAVVRFKGVDHAVDWREVVELEGQDRHLLPTCFSEGVDGRMLLGSHEAPGWAVRNGIKMALLQSDGGRASQRDVESAVMFVAAAFRCVQRWTRRHVPTARNAEIRWRLHLGVPSIADGPMHDLFLQVGRRALRLAQAPGPVSRAGVDKVPSAEIKGVAVLAELSAQMNAYHGSRQRQTDLHALLDFGAGTLDCVLFLDHENQQDGDVIGLLDSRVEPLGIHRLLAALVGKRGEQHEWEDADAARDHSQIAEITGEEVRKVSDRRTDYTNRIIRTFYGIWNNSRRLYNVGPVHRREQPLRVFMAGGGSRSDRVRKSVDRFLDQDFVRQSRIGAYTLTELPLPSRERFVYEGDAYHRMAVAHGLCEMQLNLGTYRTLADGAPVLARAPDIRDRDEDR